MELEFVVNLGFMVLFLLFPVRGEFKGECFFEYAFPLVFSSLSFLFIFVLLFLSLDLTIGLFSEDVDIFSVLAMKHLYAPFLVVPILYAIFFKGVYVYVKCKILQFLRK